MQGRVLNTREWIFLFAIWTAGIQQYVHVFVLFVINRFLFPNPNQIVKQIC